MTTVTADVTGLAEAYRRDGVVVIKAALPPE